ncbi:MAG: GntR family transcriptional regulator [Bacteroidales bacterium]|nr:GntR family transcriptional regulator [Bacteroidales bacterium]MBN2748948.1 GntR family transcriptional regulator [Bacteroidales bacterium]
MANIGKYNKLRVVKLVDFGAYLDGGTLGEILIPIRYLPEGTQPEDELEVFLYLDSEDRPIATTEHPFATVDEFAFLQVVAVTRIGAFMDWGLPKDLLVPFREQKVDMQVGRWYVVRIYLDQDTQRIVGSAKVSKYLDNVPPTYTVGEEVDVLINNETDLGYNAIVNNLHWGMIYKNEVFAPIRVGQRTKAYIKKVREDEKIDLLLDKPGHTKLDDLAQKVIDALNQNKGSLPLGDKTDPEIIYSMLGMSKKNFKKAIGTLYRMQMVEISDNGVKLV